MVIQLLIEAKVKKKRKTPRCNKKGLIKTDMFCPARLMCKVDNQTGSVSVKFIQTHSHTPEFKDTEHHPIPKSILEDIKQKFILGATVDHVFNECREGKSTRENREESDSMQRKHVISKRQLREISRKLKVNRRMHEDDATSIDYIVKKLQKEKFNPVLLYKPQGKMNFEVFNS